MQFVYKSISSCKFNIESVGVNYDHNMSIKVGLQFTMPKHYVMKAYGVAGEAPHIPHLDNRRK
jgi:hypothetical protein